MSSDAKAFWIAAPGRGEIRDEVIGTPAADEIQVRTLFSGISRGTESLVFAGRVPPSEHQRMAAPFQQGHFPAPVKYGYANVGVVEAGPAQLVDRVVFTLFPHQTRFLVPASAAHLVPDTVPPQRAVLAANIETAVNILWDARPHIGDRITVVGAGTVGCLAACLAARVIGCAVELVDINPARAQVARALGVGFALPAAAQTDVDLVIHASGRQEGLATALQIAGVESTVVEASWFGAGDVSVPLGEAFHARRLTIRSSQVGSVAPSQRARWSYGRRMGLALTLLSDPVLDALITGESAFETLPGVMAELAAAPGDALCQRVRY
jgi:hypothetical protein